MKREELLQLGISEDVVPEVMKIYGSSVENLKSENEALTTNVGDLTKQIDELSEQIKAYDGTDELVKVLQGKVDAYEKAEVERKEKIERDKAEKLLTDNILEVIGDRQFVNSITKNAVIEQVKVALKDEANAGKGAKEIFEELTKDSTDIFANPQQKTLVINGSAKKDDDGAEKDDAIRKIMGLPTRK